MYPNMKFNKFIVASLALCAFLPNAQAQEEAGVEYDYEFQPHFYIQAAAGAQATLGEVDFGDLVSFNAQLGVGYNFTPVFGTRLIVNSWRSKAGLELGDNTYKWHWDYIAPSLDLTVDLTNLIGGFNPDRKWSAGIFVGAGANIGFSNDDANDINDELKGIVYKGQTDAPNVLRRVWDDTKVRFQGQFGLYGDYNINERWKVGLELQANLLHDSYNSKKACNVDWFYNGLISAKYILGKTHTKTARAATAATAAAAAPQVVEKIVEVPVVKEVIKEVPAALRRDVFFKISTTKVTKDEMYKVAEVADYLKTYPDSKVTVTGYADKGTGSMSLNLRLSAQRAQAVVDALVNEFGISKDRITSSSMGEDAEQPFSDPVLNRVAICVAK